MKPYPENSAVLIDQCTLCKITVTFESLSPPRTLQNVCYTCKDSVSLVSLISLSTIFLCKDFLPEF